MTLEQKDINQLYDIAVDKAKEIIGNKYYRKPNTAQDFKEKLYTKLRFHFIVQPGNLKWKRNGYYYYPSHHQIEQSLSPVAKLFKRRRLSFFVTELSKETIMLHKVLDKVTEEYFNSEDKCWLDIDSAVNNMDSALDELEKINIEGEKIHKELSKIPNFIESGSWE